VEEEVKKVKTDFDAKAKELADKTAAEQKANTDAAALKTEKVIFFSFRSSELCSTVLYVVVHFLCFS